MRGEVQEASVKGEAERRITEKRSGKEGEERVKEQRRTEGEARGALKIVSYETTHPKHTFTTSILWPHMGWGFHRNREIFAVKAT